MGGAPGTPQSRALAAVREKHCPFYYIIYKMENMTELRALTRERRLRGYS